MTAGVNVLDHGYVQLVSHMGDDLTVVSRARHRPDNEWRGDKDVKLINYLMKHKHTSPFEFVEFDFHVKLPIFVARQWMRHRTWNYNEVSARYQELPEEFYVPDPKVVGVQSESNHQGRVIEDYLKNPDRLIPSMISYSVECSFDSYKTLLQAGCPRELARCVLPLSTYTEMSAKVDLHNLLHFLTLRCDEHAQYEIRVYAEAILKLITPIVPVTIAAWNTYRKSPEQEQPGVAKQLFAIAEKLDTLTSDRLYVTKGYTIGDLRRELIALIGTM